MNVNVREEQATPPAPSRPASPSSSRGALLIFTQVFVPDPASVGQHVADVAFEIARRGHRVRVYASARGYEDPSVKYPPRETLGGVEVRRLPLSSFGKKSIPTRVLGTAAFMAQIFFVGLFSRNVAGIFFSTSPPLVGLVATLVARLRGLPCVYWAMDLNPDQLIAMGKIAPASFTARVLEAANRLILRRADLIVALDRFMADRLEQRGRLRHKMLVLPPWPHDDHIGIHDNDAAPAGDGAAAAENPFRARHGLGGKFVVMYSGNHSPANPLDTLLEAARRLRGRDDLRFLFVGGGIGKPKVESFIREHALANALSLPYQPLAELRHSLSAADVHVVSLGEGMAGIIHPCKVYGAMAAARPILYLGPRPSHITDLLDKHRLGWQVAHGDADAAVAALEAMRALDRRELVEMGQGAAAVLNENLSQQRLCGAFCDRVVRTIWGAAHLAAASRTTQSLPEALGGN